MIVLTSGGNRTPGLLQNRRQAAAEPCALVDSGGARQQGIQLRVASRDGIAAEPRHPTLGVVEEAQSAEAGLWSHVEPVAGACWHADPVVALADQLQHLLAQVQAEQAAALDEEAHLVFGVGVLSQELLAQGQPIGMVGAQADRIDRAIAAFGLDKGDFAGIGGQDRLAVRIRLQIGPGGPALEADSPGGQLPLNQLAVLADQPGGGGVVGVDGKQAHCWQARTDAGSLETFPQVDRPPALLPLTQPLSFPVQSLGPGLTLVGVGPGDPDLLTVAAVRAIAAAAVVAYPVAREGAAGMAATIAAPWIRSDQEQLPLLFPMVAGAEPRRLAWRAAADRLAAEVAAGRAVVLLCEGDVSLFATGSYVLLALKQHHPDCPVRLLPGISAVAAAAAAAAFPLALQQEGLLIRPTPESPEALEALLALAASEQWVLGLLKLGHRWAWVRPILEARGLLDQALFAQRVGWPDQLLGPAAAVAAEEHPYFSLLLVRQGWPAVLP